ncbi:tyrosine-type recombinase/integrase [Lentibacillus cibarius]|nr:tyrosine-type recombinase/integrase [Lentibacillus cibarius]
MEDQYWKLKRPLVNDENKRMIEDYLLKLKETGLKRVTINGYRKDLQHFFKDQQAHFSSLSWKDISNHFQSNYNLKNSSYRTKLSSLDGFYHFCAMEGYLANSPIPSEHLTPTKRETQFMKEKYYELTKPLANVENEKVIDEYLSTLNQNGLNRMTLMNYKNTLTSFFVDKEAPFSALSWEDISKHFLDYQTHLTDYTYQGYVSILTAFYNFCVQRGYMPWSPMKKRRFVIQEEKQCQDDAYWKPQKPIVNQENKKVIEDFLLSFKLANRSRNTIILYRKYLEVFFGDQKEVFSSIPSEVIFKTLKYHTSHLKISTYQKFLTVLSSFYNFCVEEGYLDKTPIKKRWYPRLPKALPKYLTKKDIAKLRKVTEKESLRNQILVEFMLVSGSRVGEVRNLNVEDIDLETRTAQVKGKGNKMRYVHFTEKCALLLERHLDANPGGDFPLISGPTGKRLTIIMMEVIIRRLGKEAGLSTPLHPHRLRHTFATNLLTKGADLAFISRELGHSDLATTQVYARLPKQEIITQYRRFME